MTTATETARPAHHSTARERLGVVGESLGATLFVGALAYSATAHHWRRTEKRGVYAEFLHSAHEVAAHADKIKRSCHNTPPWPDVPTYAAWRSSVETLELKAAEVSLMARSQLNRIAALAVQTQWDAIDLHDKWAGGETIHSSRFLDIVIKNTNIFTKAVLEFARLAALELGTDYRLTHRLRAWWLLQRPMAKLAHASKPRRGSATSHARRAADRAFTAIRQSTPATVRRHLPVRPFRRQLSRR